MPRRLNLNQRFERLVLPLSMALVTGCVTPAPQSVRDWRRANREAARAGVPRLDAGTPSIASRPAPANPAAPPAVARRVPTPPAAPKIEDDTNREPLAGVAEPRDRSPLPIPLLGSPPQLPRLDVPEQTAGNGLELQVSAPLRTQVGGQVTYRVVVKNVSDAKVEDVAVRCRFEAPLIFPGSEQEEVACRIEQLAPGESKELLLSLVCHKTGSHSSSFRLTRRENERDVEVASKQVSVQFVDRQLDIALVGPSQRTEGSRAEFNATLVNRSARELTNVQVKMTFDRALAPREASQGYERRTGALSWSLGTLAPAETVTLQSEFECLSRAHRACVDLEVSAGEFASEREEACLEIVPVPGTLDLRISDRDDPLEVGKTGRCDVAVENIGLQPARNLVLTATVPAQVRIVGANVRLGNSAVPVQYAIRDGKIVFDLVGALPSESTLRYQIEIEALRPGTVELQASLTSSLSSVPLTVSEPMSIQTP